MFSMGFFQDVESILSEIPEPAQGMFVSATISARVTSLARKFLKNPENIKAGTEDEEMPEVDHFYYNVDGGVTDKPRALGDLIESLNPKSAIIFCNTKSETELVEAVLRRRGIDARRINSDLNQSQRTSIMQKARDGQLRILVATDIAARGIDIEALGLVINFSLPAQHESYVHRTGRAGRGNNRGKAISLVGPHDTGAFRTIKLVVNVEIKKQELPLEEDLAIARLESLSDNLKKHKQLLRPRDHALAKRILEEFGGISEPTPELEKFIARMACFTVEHFVSLDSVSLEEELQNEPKESGKPHQGKRHKNSRNDRSGGGRR